MGARCLTSKSGSTLRSRRATGLTGGPTAKGRRMADRRFTEVEFGGHAVEVPAGGYYDRFRMNPDLDQVARDPAAGDIDFFRRIPKRLVDSRVGPVSAPDFYYRSSSVQLLLRTPIDRLRATLPTPLEPLRAFPGTGLVLFLCGLRQRSLRRGVRRRGHPPAGRAGLACAGGAAGSHAAAQLLRARAGAARHHGDRAGARRAWLPVAQVAGRDRRRHRRRGEGQHRRHGRPAGSGPERAAPGLAERTLKIYPGYPHGMHTTHADAINADLLAFIRG